MRTSVLLALVCVTGSVASSAAELSSPLSPADSLPHFKLAPGLRIELAAAEPQVMDPIEVRFDESGRMWVVEMGDYPYGPEPGKPPQSRIKMLDDMDGDGFFETASLFADQLLFVTGIQPWKGGLIVTMAGEVAYFRDQDGDGDADLRETWYRGFAQENSQLRANHPRLGLDGFIYIANGLRGGSVVDARRTEKPPVPLANLDFRFDPETGEFESLTGVGQFGLTFDDFGNRFICSNRNPLMHIVFEDRWLKRNPRIAIPELRHDVAKAGEQSRVFAISRAWTTSNLHAGQFTAACGVVIYRGDGLPKNFYGAGFTCDPTGNLVHCELLKPHGATFMSTPEREGVEFLASPDEWFRPVNTEFGPDGALYVVDMYRAVIEHPDFVPQELKKRPDQMLGTDRGRIYRVTSADRKNPRSPVLANAGPDELVRTLDHPNGWHRESARRLLLEQKNTGARAGLEQLLMRQGLSAGRVAALWTLHRLGTLDDSIIRAVLMDPDPRLREQAVAVCEQRLTSSPTLREVVRKLAVDSDSRVRFQVALSLTPAQDAEDVAALAKLLTRNVSDPWTRRAVALSAGERSVEVALDCLRQVRQDSAGGENLQAALEELLGTVGAADSSVHQEIVKAIAHGFSKESDRRFRFRLLKSWLQSLGRVGKDLRVVSEGSDSVAKDQLLTWLREGVSVATELSHSDDVRIEALEVVAFDPALQKVLVDLARIEPSQPVRIRAISLAGRRSEIETWKEFLAVFGKSSPSVRRALLENTLTRSDRCMALLDELERKQIKAGEVDQLTASRLLKHSDKEVRDRATKILSSAIPSDRQQALADYQKALELVGDPLRGRLVFSKHCANCHRIGELGVNVAPDISDSRVKTAAQFLTDILQPNRAIDNNYVSYMIETVNGETMVGVLSAETATSVTLRMPEGKSATLLRTEIEDIRSTGVSLMPEGLEKNIPHAEMADLLSFIKNWRYLDGRTPYTK